MKIAQAVYDLLAGPMTMDFLGFLSIAELQRRTHLGDGIKVTFVPGDRKASPRDLVYTPARKHFRLWNLLVPACELLPSVCGVEVAVTRPQPEPMKTPYMFREVFQAYRGEDPRCFIAPPEASLQVKAWLKQFQSKTLCITLRRSDFEPLRNSNLEAWRALALYAQDQGWQVIVVDDTEGMLREPLEFPGVHFPSSSLIHRMALWEQVSLNMLSAQGVSALFFLSKKVKFLDIRYCNPEVPITSREHHISQGIIPGRQLPHFSETQKIVWAQDTKENLIEVLNSWKN